MATLALTAVASTAISSFGLSASAAIAAKAVATVAGKNIDSKLLKPLIRGKKKKRNKIGRRMSNLSIQTSTYGEVIPSIYGTARVAGNVIWARPIKEIATTTTSSGGGKGGGSAKQTNTDFSYSATLAIAISEGEVDEVMRVWADSKVIDPNDYPNSYVLYTGSETQMPDPTIESFEGVGEVPAFRGLAYVVIEDFPLADFGNRLPNFTFEVKKSLLQSDFEGDSAENMVTCMTLIPGSGEFVYDTIVQSKITGEQVGAQFIQGSNRVRINQNNRSNKADTLVAIDQLLETCPNLEWVSLVVTWFGDNMDAGLCTIQPGVEYKNGATTDPDIWSVESFTRSSARQITLDGNGAPVYGGTPTDSCVINCITELKNRGLKVMLYPMFFMDVANKPWRGRVTGTPTDVANFFTKTDGYNRFINHYASIAAGRADAFVIGSELIGLTSVKDGSNNFAAVDALVNLAAIVKTTVGAGVQVTYAADWSEYHHEVDGWYNLDALWASPNIDFIGIDSYFPLSDEPQSGYDTQKVIDGWTSGEGYDWYYSDPERTIKANLEAKYAWKNMDWWWRNNHVNPDLTTTTWVPESKKIWFTEYGFPSVDGATNQPNVFYDPSSSESFFPRFSKGRIDLRAQRQGIVATEKQWEGSAMVENKFLWTWDARPFPFWPSLKEIWTDGDLWKTGHWVQGKLGLSGLASIVADICRKSGLLDAQFDVTLLNELVDGYVIDEQETGANAIENLQLAYFFDAVESDGVVKFVPRAGSPVATINDSNIVRESRKNTDDTDVLSIRRVEELSLPQMVNVKYLNRNFEYQIGTQNSQRLATSSIEAETLSLPIVMEDNTAKIIADKTLFNSWIARNSYDFKLSMEYADLEPTDVVDIVSNGVSHRMRITEITAENPSILQIKAVAEDVSVYDFYSQSEQRKTLISALQAVGDTQFEILDLPNFPSDANDQSLVRFAATGLESGWKGAAIYRSDDTGVSYVQIGNISEAATMGATTDILNDFSANILDETSVVTVLLLSGQLQSVTKEALLNGANSCLIGNEICQFMTANLIAENKYELSGFLRARLGTEAQTGNHSAGDRFVLLDEKIIKLPITNSAMGFSRKYKLVSIGATLAATSDVDFTYSANNLKPFSPVHIRGLRDENLNLDISWVRRTRIGGQWQDNIDVALGENFEKYEVDILNGASIVRSFTGLGINQVTYNAADQLVDFGAVQSSVSVNIYQISDVVGRGIAGAAEI